MASILERNKNAKIQQKQKKTREDYAEDALYREVWEEVNNEKTMAFLKKYSRYLVAGAIGILIVATAIQIGVRTHRASKLAVAENYEAAVQNIDASALASIGQNASGATADLALFQSYLLDNDVAKLDKLATDGNTRDFRDLARLHIVGIRGDEMTPVELEKYLSGMDTKKSPFYYTSRLMVAQKYLAAGDKATANKWLDKIISDTDAPASIVGTAQSLK